MYNFDKSIKKMLGKARSTNYTPPKTSFLSVSDKRSSPFFKQKTKNLLGLAKGSIFFPFTQPTVKHPISGHVIKGHQPTVQRVMKNFFGDKDKDGVNNLMDCKPNNFKKQGFMDKTTIPIADYPESYGYRGELKHISPQQFLKTVQLESEDPHWRTATPEEYEKSVIFKPRLKGIKKGLRKKEAVVPALWIETERGIPVGHEGRHRAVAARELGFKSVPVRFTEKQPGWQVGKNLMEDKDKDGIIAAADNDDNNPNNPRYRHYKWKSEKVKLLNKDFIPQQIQIRPAKSGSFDDDELPKILAMLKKKREKEERERYREEQIDKLNKMFPVDKKKDKPYDDRDGDGIINIEDCDPDNPNKQDDWKQIIDYVAGGQKPYGTFSTYKDPNYMSQILSYVKARGLQYTIGETELGIPEVVVFKSGVQPLQPRQLWRTTREKGEDVVLGYPKEAVERWKEKGGAIGAKDISEQYPNIPLEELNYLDFNPSGMSEQDVRAEIEKRKLIVTTKALTPEQVLEQNIKYGLIVEGPRTKEIIKRVEAAPSKEEARKILLEEEND